MIKRTLLGFGLLMLGLANLAAAGEAKAGAWMEGWLLRAPLETPEPSASYSVILEHGGALQPDARDLRVVDGDGAPVSHFVAHADDRTLRVIFDGAARSKAYALYWGNPDPNLAPAPQGVVPFGRPDWMPLGGYSARSFSTAGPFSRLEMLHLKPLLETFERIRERSRAAEDEQAQKQPDPKKRQPFRAENFYPNTSVPFGTPAQWFHHFRAEIEIKTAGKYRFVVGDENFSHQYFNLLLLDENRESAAIPGWYTEAYGGTCYDLSGEVELKPGVHVLELLTNRDSPRLRMGNLSTGSLPEFLNGMQAHFRDAAPVTPGPVEASGQAVERAWVAIANAWIEQGRHERARALCRFAELALHAQPEWTQQFRAVSERAAAAAYDRDWLTESKGPDRAGYVPGSAFQPPLKWVQPPTNEPFNLGGAVWARGKLWNAFPFQPQDKPWNLTSALCLHDGILYGSTKNGAVHALDLERERTRWSFPAGGACVGAPLVYRNRLYLGSLDRRVYALDLATGRMAWNYPANGWIEGGPCAANGRIVVASQDGCAYALDAESGVERWRAKLGAESSATPSTDGRTVFLGNHAGTFFALDLETGAERWRYSAQSPIRGGSCLAEGCVYFGDDAGMIHALRSDTGAAAWPQATPVGGPVHAAPIRVGSILYGGTMEGDLYGIDAATGSRGWTARMPLTHGSQKPGAVARPAAYAEGRLIFMNRRRTGGGGVTVIYGAGHAGPLQIPRSDASAKADGVLDEPLWQRAAALPLYRSNGMAGDDELEARVTWDAERLYVGLVRRVLPGKSAPVEGARISVYLDPRRNGAAVCRFTLAFPMNLEQEIRTVVEAGGQAERIAKEVEAWKLKDRDPEFKPEWSAASGAQAPAFESPSPAAPGEVRWTAELAIPFAALPKALTGPPANGTTWLAQVVISAPPGEDAKPWAATPTAEDTVAGRSNWIPLQFMNEIKK
ncbi:MAG: hypothetical protein AMXMBFR7_22330 [Planctomycetota bacterium]